MASVDKDLLGLNALSEEKDAEAKRHKEKMDKLKQKEERLTKRLLGEFNDIMIKEGAIGIEKQLIAGAIMIIKEGVKEGKHTEMLATFRQYGAKYGPVQKKK